MTHLLVAQFPTAEAMTSAARSAAEAGNPAEDALTPFPVPEAAAHLRPRRKRPLGWVITIGAAAAAGGAWLMQWYSATIDYPIISGNRPFNSWPIFFLVSYEACILFGGIAGFVAFARDCRFPSLHHPLFEVTALERASQDRFFLTFEASESDRDETAALVSSLHPLTVSELAL